MKLGAGLEVAEEEVEIGCVVREEDEEEDEEDEEEEETEGGGSWNLESFRETVFGE